MEPNERGQTNDRPNLIDKPVAKPGLFVSTPRAREKRGKTKEKEKKRTERRKKTKVLPATTHASRDTKKEGLPAIQGHPRRKEGEEKKEREKERGREREGKG